MKLLILSAAILVTCLGQIFAQEGSVQITVLTTFDYPGTDNAYAYAINNSGDVTGNSTSDSRAIGFIRKADGSFSPPIVDKLGYNGPDPTGINDSDTICGYYRPANSGLRGFLYSQGKVTAYRVPGAEWTQLAGINNAGDFTGTYVTDRRVNHGFINSGGQLSLITLPGSRHVYPAQITDSGLTAGYYTTHFKHGPHAHGFYRDADGGLHYPIDLRGAWATMLYGINDDGWMVGVSFVTGKGGHGVIYRAPGQFLVFDYPDAMLTLFTGINSQNEIVGTYFDTDYKTHGFIAQLTQDR